MKSCWLSGWAANYHYEKITHSVTIIVPDTGIEPEHSSNLTQIYTLIVLYSYISFMFLKFCDLNRNIFIVIKIFLLRKFMLLFFFNFFQSTTPLN